MSIADLSWICLCILGLWSEGKKYSGQEKTLLALMGSGESRAVMANLLGLSVSPPAAARMPWVLCH